MPMLFGLTMLISATLLFLVQPMIGKMILPLLGGTPAVWNTCMVFFQALLLAGYAYAHKLTTSCTPSQQVKIHFGVFVSAILALGCGALLSPEHSTVFIAKSLAPQGSDIPFFGVIAVLGIAIGLPFFVVSTTAPLLQKWFSETGHPSAKDPYFLYAASNTGSLLSLFAYPIFVEPNFRLVYQAWIWSIGFIILGFFIVRCGMALIATAPKNRTTTTIEDQSPPPSWLTWLRWLILAAVPSSLMLSVTTEITTDVVSIPLIWIVPLALYLITFIIVFSKQYTPMIHLGVSLITPVCILLVVFLRMTMHVPDTVVGTTFKSLIVIQFLLFFLITLVCHGELARIRPTPKYLTNFYLTMSLGGMLGGLFNALIAPIAFTFVSEYPLSIIAACLVLPKLSELSQPDEPKEKEEINWFALVIIPLLFFAASKLLSGFYPDIVSAFDWIIKKVDIVLSPKVAATIFAFGLPTLAAYFLVERPVRFGLAVAGLFLGVFLTFLRNEKASEDYHTLYQRSFFGQLKIETGPTYVRLVHGTTLHGKQRHLEVSVAEGLLPMLTDDPWSNLTSLAVAQKQWFKPGREPLTYYHQTGPVGSMFTEFAAKKLLPGANTDVACIGLGTGSLSSYGTPGQKMTFFEIDSHVRRLVEPPDHFTYIDQAKKQGVDIEFLMGDARLTLEQQDRQWGFMLIDAFSSDSIPAHLLTVESVDLYFKHLTANGLCGLHISNRYLNLEPVVEKIVKKLGLTARVMHDSATSEDEVFSGKTSSTWIVVARDEQSLGDLTKDSRWTTLKADENVGIWTDDFTPIIPILQGDLKLFGK